MQPPRRSLGAEARNHRARRRPTAGAGAREARTRKTPRPKRRQQKGQRRCQRTTDNRPAGKGRQGRESPPACQRRKGRSRPDRSQTQRTNCAQGTLPAPGGPPLSQSSGPHRCQTSSHAGTARPGKEPLEGDSPQPATPKWTDPPAHGVRGEGCRVNPKTQSVRSEPTPKGKAGPRLRARSTPYSHDSHEHPKAQSDHGGGERAEAVQPAPRQRSRGICPC